MNPTSINADWYSSVCPPSGVTYFFDKCLGQEQISGNEDRRVSPEGREASRDMEEEGGQDKQAVPRGNDYETLGDFVQAGARGARRSLLSRAVSFISPSSKMFTSMIQRMYSVCFLLQRRPCDIFCWEHCHAFALTHPRPLPPFLLYPFRRD